MANLRRLTIAFAPPLVYAAVLIVLFLTEHPPKAVYQFAEPTVMTVSDKGGPLILHAPPPIYPPEALHDRVEGSVTLKVTIAADGTVARAVPVTGPQPLRQAAIENVRQWQFEAKAQDSEVEIAFSPGYVTHSLTLPEPLRRVAPARQGSLHGSVRVVALVDPEGRVETVRPVMGPEKLMPAAMEAVRQWTFRPMLRDGKAEHGTAVVDVPFGL
jgi:TonB family protein